MIQIHVPYGDPYREMISNLLADEFPQMNGNDASQTLEYLTRAIIATNQIRYGPAPKPEALVEIRKTIMRAIEANTPIHILMPWGSRKTRLTSGIDLAEVMALKTLACLQSRVTARYSPGVAVRIRIEDASGNYLFAEEGERSRVMTEKYTHDFIKLVEILDYWRFLHPVLESGLFTEAEFIATSQIIEPALYDYLMSADAAAHAKLVELGWQGGIVPAQKDYYLERYYRLYPGITVTEASRKLAVYLAGAWARRKLNGYGDDPSWKKDYLRMTFAAPVPGAPTIYSRDIFYRTLPMKYATTHIAPWRAKGYIQIDNEQAVPKLANWGEAKDFNSLVTTFSNGVDKVDVQSDYVTI